LVGLADDLRTRIPHQHASHELWLRAFIAVAYAFGFRKSELLKMSIRQVDLLNRTITLEKQEMIHLSPSRNSANMRLGSYE